MRELGGCGETRRDENDPRHEDILLLHLYTDERKPEREGGRVGGEWEEIGIRRLLRQR